MATVANSGAIPPSRDPAGDIHAGHSSAAGSAADANPASSSFPAILAQATSRLSPVAPVNPRTSQDGLPTGHRIGTTADEMAQPRHFPIGTTHKNHGHGFQERALALRAYRQQIIASNIANADTPGYLARDVDVNAILRETAAPLPLMVSSPVHLLATGTGHYPLVYHVPGQTSADGNTVEMDVERGKFAENALMYEFSLDRAGGHYKHLMEMLQNLKD